MLGYFIAFSIVIYLFNESRIDLYFLIQFPCTIEHKRDAEYRTWLVREGIRHNAEGKH